MNSVYDFIVEPVGERYNNQKKINGKKLILNTSIESFKFINKLAKVKSIPLAYKTPLKPNDYVMIHHNVFRRYYDIRGKEKNSSKFLFDNKYFCQVDQIYLYNNGTGWKSFGDRCFVKPIVNKDDLTLDKLAKHIGILKYDNSSLNKLGIKSGDCIGFTPNSEFEFIIDNEFLYCMKSNDIVIKYEQQKNKTEYNPSWAKSS
tara:strand:- start:26311 stop:26916 length:606 start_codon:yes stop_codon:yes gene_type:complete